MYNWPDTERCPANLLQRRPGTIRHRTVPGRSSADVIIYKHRPAPVRYVTTQEKSLKNRSVPGPLSNSPLMCNSLNSYDLSFICDHSINLRSLTSVYFVHFWTFTWLEHLQQSTDPRKTFFCQSIIGGLLKPGIGWDWMESDGTRSRVLAFGTFESRVPGFDVIAITDLIYLSPLAINDRERMCIVLAGLIDLLQSIYQNFICCIVK